ncbi:MAG: porin family protein [Nonlabens sp.]|uniref:porin family protein n=3 Tax=Nonlabens sp. TaxID=1888209 RepID=UPI00321AFC2E
MKKIILSIALLSCVSFVNGQFLEDISYGFRLGLNYSTLSGDNIEDVDDRIGMHVNFFADIPISDRFSLQPEIGISSLGVNEEELRLENGDIVQFKTNWLQVGVLGNINITKQLFALVGPQVGVNITERDNNDYYNYDVAGVIGIGYMFNENLGIDARYGYGFSNIFDREFAEIEEANNRWFQLGVSYKM